MYRKGIQQAGNTHCTSLVSGTGLKYTFCSAEFFWLPASYCFRSNNHQLTPVLQGKSCVFAILSSSISNHPCFCCMQHSPYSPFFPSVIFFKHHYVLPGLITPISATQLPAFSSSPSPSPCLHMVVFLIMGFKEIGHFKV